MRATGPVGTLLCCRNGLESSSRASRAPLFAHLPSRVRLTAWAEEAQEREGS